MCECKIDLLIQKRINHFQSRKFLVAIVRLFINILLRFAQIVRTTQILLHKAISLQQIVIVLPRVKTTSVNFVCT